MTTKPAGRSISFVAVEIVRFPSNTEPKVARSEVPLPVKSAAANDCAESIVDVEPSRECSIAIARENRYLMIWKVSDACDGYVGLAVAVEVAHRERKKRSNPSGKWTLRRMCHRRFPARW